MRSLKKLLTTLFLYLTLCVSMPAHADDQAAIAYVQEVFELFTNTDPSQIFVELKHRFDNLICYEVTFAPEVKIGPSKGIVDDLGNYVIYDAEITTDSKEIQKLIASTTRFATGQVGSNDFANLLAYAGPEGQLYYIDSANRYALLSGQVTDLSSDGFSSLLVYYSQFGNLSSSEPFSAPSPFSSHVYKSWKSFRWGREDAPKTMHVFGDPNCLFCHYFYEGLKPYVDSGELSVYWGMLTFINPTSKGISWAIFDGDTPVGSGYPATPEGAFEYNEDNFDVINEQGGLPPSSDPSKKAIKAVTSDINGSLSVGLPATPFIFYNNLQGKPTIVLGSVPPPDPFYPNLVASIESK